MPNLKSFLKPGTSGTGGTTNKKQNQAVSTSEKSPRLGLFRRHSRSNKNRSESVLRKSGSQSLMMSYQSSTSMSSCGSPTCKQHPDGSSPRPRDFLNMPKCNTVANFGVLGGGGHMAVSPPPSKCNSLATFTGLSPSLRTSLASLGFSRCASAVGIGGPRFHRCRSSASALAEAGSRACSAVSLSGEPLVLCRLCLCDVPVSQMMSLDQCACQYCRTCLQQYVAFQVLDGNLQISCPDAWCDQKGGVTNDEIESLLEKDLYERYQRYLLNHEVDLDPNRVWCPRAGCETICYLMPEGNTAVGVDVHCPECGHHFCSQCKARWHSNQSCEMYARKRAKTASHEDEFEKAGPSHRWRTRYLLKKWDKAGPLASYEENGFIKRCPLCHIPIERNDGCAQMMCKRCKHVFCWYCLASLDNDFMLRHYDKGPCKNMLGHSRASLFLHRTQVVGIFAGLGLLLLVASPLLLLVAPCILCSNCRSCDLNEDEVMPATASSLSSASVTTEPISPVSGI